jgi:teichuronic acid biosynthesis glycosyltransferase TuaC
VKPKIAVLASYFPTRDEAHRGHSAYQTLRKMNHLADIRAICTTAKYPDVGFLKPRGFVSRDVALDWSPADVAADYATYPTIPYLGRVTSGRACLAAARPFLDRFQPDLILNYWLYPEGWAAVKYAREKKIPSLVCSVGSDLRRVEDSWTKRETEWTVRNASHVLTVSRELREQAIRFGADANRTTAILNGCDTQVFYPRDRAAMRQQLGVNPQSELIVYVGNVIPTKGLFELMDAFSQLATRRPQAELVFIGRGQSLGALQAKATERGLGQRIRFTGVLSSAEVARWMGAANLFTLPSYSEGCPNVVIEALASGRANVATNVGGIPELIDQQLGVLVPPKDVSALENGLESALNKSWDEETIARRYARSWQDAADDTWAICEKVLAEARVE